MKKLHLLTLTVFLSFTGNCFGQWMFVSETDTFKDYIDYSRIKTEGRYKSIWVLRDHKSPQTNSLSKQYNSETIKHFFDCMGPKNQIVAFYEYSGQMGRGEIINSSNRELTPSGWRNPPPDSIDDGHAKIACATNSNPKPPVSNTQDIKRQRCINLGLAPNSADFQQCIK
jgi:hypothetical protein